MISVDSSLLGSAGEWSFTNDSPYFSVCNGIETLAYNGTFAM